VPPPPSGKDGDVVWLGRWDDDLREFFVDPVRDLGLRARAYGADYPEGAKSDLADRGITCSRPVPNFRVPDVFARFKCTIHVPDKSRMRALPGIPAIRVFEALACAIPLVCAPWEDTEGLFTPGRDYLVAQDGGDMKRHLRLLVNDAHARSELSRHGRSTILARHTCAHRVDELIAIAGDLGVRVRRPMLVNEGAVS
jgi:spore maturation protein CgeB